MRGSSGAAITVGDETALKRGNDRVVEQGRWLESHCELTSSLPRVIEVHDDGYTMERLHVPELEDLNDSTVYAKILFALEGLWGVPSSTPLVGFDMGAHLKRLEPLIPASRLTPVETQTMIRVLSKINWIALPKALTHGDPIIDNVLMRGSELVLIDPIPATPAIPDVRASDMGRVLQSVLGYEKHRYGYDYMLEDPHHWIRHQLFSFMESPYHSVKGANELMAVVYFAVFHLMRSTVYVSNKVAMDIHDHCIVKGIAILETYERIYMDTVKAMRP